MSAEHTLFEGNESEIYVVTKITKCGVVHRISDATALMEGVGTPLTTKQLQQVVDRLQGVVNTYKEMEEEG